MWWGADEPEELTRAEALALLGTRDVGRLGLSVGALPSVVPVRYTLDDGAILLTMAADPRLVRATRDAVLAFQTDRLEPVGECWSVLVQGPGSGLQAWEDGGDVPAGLAPAGVRRSDLRLVRLALEIVEGQRWRAQPGDGR